MSLEDYTNAELNAEVERRKNMKKAPKRKALSDINFNLVIEMAMEAIEEAEIRGYIMEDTDHYIYEGVMTAVYGEEIWEFINSLDN